MYLCYFFGLISFVLNRKHFLLMLLTLEMIVLLMYVYMYLILLYYNNELYFNMIFLIMSVCEGVLGLSLLIALVRSYGNDYFQSFNILW
uniref:NADH-ubiquinone oxidoreductase chain 4L n=1 Tax=Ptiliidae sp. BMNH 1274726 TaxID=1796538 RepID=A0A126TGJ5_9COLE|nr:NADH dehydrogenase subunit 4L [Ptiliidae sp. BMNH 1274726]